MAAIVTKKQVLIIDASPMFREFLREKLSEENIVVETAQGHRDAFIKLSSNMPDLVILDIEKSIEDMQDFFEKKQLNPNTVHIPMIISGPHIEKEQVQSLLKYGVVKYFTRPIKFDIFFESIGRILRSAFSMDTTPCVLEIHLNKNIIFIEMAQGMNREKMALLKYKLTELMDNNRLDSPKVIIMMTDLSLSFVDGSNLELLFDNVLADRRIERKNVKVLSLDSFTKELIDGHPEYSGIEVVTNLSQVLNSIVESGPTASIQDLISDQILTSTDNGEEGSVEMRFYSDTGTGNTAEADDTLISDELTVAIVDDDAVVRQLLAASFKTINAKSDLFASGAEFLQAANTKNYSLIILDIFMPGISGFDILKTLRQHQVKSPVIVYSQAAQKEAIIQSLTLGAKTYLVKPQKPEVIIQKAMEILNGKI
jgi:DNA-binding response OmpR family regulator